MKKISLIVLIFIICGSFLFMGKSIYSNYQSQKHKDKIIKSIYKFDQLFFEKANRDLKTNDLIFMCELVRSLKNDGVGIEKINDEGFKNNRNLKEFFNSINEDILKDKAYELVTGENTLDRNRIITAYLCTINDQGNPDRNSVYTKFLTKKYQLNTNFDSIGMLEMSRISDADIYEYKKSKLKEKEFREKF